MNINQPKQKQGFTIVELLIVIIVIGILAAITVVAYNGIQARAHNAKIEQDLTLLERAIVSARISEGSRPLRFITGDQGTAYPCTTKAAGTDLATLNKETDICWTRYNTSLNRISEASGVVVNNMVDPWGRPYYIDENEREGESQCGVGRDVIGVFKRPFEPGWGSTHARLIPFITPGC